MDDTKTDSKTKKGGKGLLASIISKKLDKPVESEVPASVDFSEMQNVTDDFFGDDFSFDDAPAQPADQLENIDTDAGDLHFSFDDEEVQKQTSLQFPSETVPAADAPASIEDFSTEIPTFDELDANDTRHELPGFDAGFSKTDFSDVNRKFKDTIEAPAEAPVSDDIVEPLVNDDSLFEGDEILTEKISDSIAAEPAEEPAPETIVEPLAEDDSIFDDRPQIVPEPSAEPAPVPVEETVMQEDAPVNDIIPESGIPQEDVQESVPVAEESGIPQEDVQAEPASDFSVDDISFDLQDNDEKIQNAGNADDFSMDNISFEIPEDFSADDYLEENGEPVPEDITTGTHTDLDADSFAMEETDSLASNPAFSTDDLPNFDEAAAANTVDDILSEPFRSDDEMSPVQDDAPALSDDAPFSVDQLPDFGDTEMQDDAPASADDAPFSVDQLPDFDDTEMQDDAPASADDTPFSVDQLPDFGDTSMFDDPFASSDAGNSDFSYDLPGAVAFDDEPRKKASFFDMPELEESSVSFSNSFPDEQPVTRDTMREDLHTESNSYTTGSAFDFSGLYDDPTKTTSGSSRSAAVICIICAIICILAVVMLLFAIPNVDISSILKPNGQTAAEAESEQGEQNKHNTTVDFEARENEILVAHSAASMLPSVPKRKTDKMNGQNVRYKIKWGDTLWDLADTYYKNPWKYRKIADFNGIKDPDFIISGTHITIPAE